MPMIMCEIYSISIIQELTTRMGVILKSSLGLENIYYCEHGNVMRFLLGKNSGMIV